MLNVMASTAESENPGLVRSNRDRDEDNLEWLKRQLQVLEMKRDVSAKSTRRGEAIDEATDLTPTYVMLLGGCDRPAFRLRLAQAHLRDDLWPSHWSHVALLGARQRDFGKSDVYEIPLQMRVGFESSIDTNGLQANPVSRYARASNYPNICVLRLDVPMAMWLQPRGPQVVSVLDMFEEAAGRVGCARAHSCLARLLWGVGRTPNPLFDGRGVPSAVMIDAILALSHSIFLPALTAASVRQSRFGRQRSGGTISTERARASRSSAGITFTINRPVTAKSTKRVGAGLTYDALLMRAYLGKADPDPPVVWGDGVVLSVSRCYRLRAWCSGWPRCQCVPHSSCRARRDRLVVRWSLRLVGR